MALNNKFNAKNGISVGVPLVSIIDNVGNAIFPTVSARQYLGLQPSLSGLAALVGGNSLGSALTIGTNDNYDLNLETAGSTKMTVTSAGNVGIGTITPSSLLNIYGAGPKITLEGTTNSSPGVLFKNSAGTMSLETNSVRDFAVQDNTAGTSRFIIRSNGTIGVGDYYGPSNYPQNKLSVNGSASIGYATNADTAAPSNGLIVSGNVGIGTTTSTEKLTVAGGVSATGGFFGPSITVSSFPTAGLVLTYGGSSAGASYVDFFTSGSHGGQAAARLRSSNFSGGAGFLLGKSGFFGWSEQTYAGQEDASTGIVRDSYGVIAQRNSTVPQELRIYKSYTDASNYERFIINTNVGTTSATQIGLSAAGTGQNRNLEIVTGGSTRMTILSGGNVGIGVSTPAYNLTIQTADTSAYSYSSIGILKHSSSAADGRSALTFAGDFGNSFRISQNGYTTTGTNTPNHAAFLELFNQNGLFIGTGQVNDLYAQFSTAIEKRFSIYSTLNSSITNYERLSFKPQSGGAFLIMSEALGTGVYRSIEFQNSGSTRMAITSGGNVGIGTSAPTERLNVVGNVRAEGNLSVYNLNTAVTLDRLTVDGSQGRLFTVTDALTGSLLSVNDISGLPILEVFDDDRVIMGEYASNALAVVGRNVGVGTATPNQKLTVVGNISSSSVIYASGGNSNLWNSAYTSVNTISGNNTSTYTTVNTNSANWSNAYTSVNAISANGASNYTTVNTNSANWSSNYTTTNTNSANWSNVYSTVNANSANYILDGGNTKGANLLVGTNDSFNLNLETAGTTKMTVTSTGLVGIGITAPSNTLHVYSANSEFARIERNSPSGAGSMGIYQSGSNRLLLGYNSSNGNGQADGGLISAGVVRGDAGLHLVANSSAIGGITVATSGNVGIGTITPTARLDIADTTLAGSGALSGSILKLAQTWNTTGNPTAFTLNVTNSASGAASNLLDLQVGSSSKFKVAKDGQTYGGISSDSDNGYYRTVKAIKHFQGYFAGVTNGALGACGAAWVISGTGDLAWSDSSQATSCTDLRLSRDGANILAQRNGVNAQAFRLYNTYTDPISAFERLNIKWASNILKIGTEKGSVGGLARALEFQTDDTTRISITSAGFIGFGTSTPTSVLDIPGSGDTSLGHIILGKINHGGSIRFRRGSDGATAATFGYGPTDGGLGFTLNSGGGQGTITLQAAGGPVNVYSANTNPYIFASNGSFGVGTLTPNEKLTVTGNISSTNVIYASGGNSNLWNSAYSSVNTISANGATTFTTVNTNSANWGSVYTTTNANSANWSSVYSSYNTASATILKGTISSSSQGNITIPRVGGGNESITISELGTGGNPSFNNLTVSGNLSVVGDFTYLNTGVSVTSALSVVNTGTGPALLVRQSGTTPIAHFIDADGTGDIVFANNGFVGIGTTTPASRLEVQGTGNVNWVSSGISSGTITVGDYISGGSLFVRTPGYSSGDYHCGLGIDGSYSSNVAVINIGAYGVRSSPYNSKLSFSTTNNSTITQAMMISHLGDVGIGRVTPLAKLDVNGTAFINTTGDGGTGAKLTVGGTGTTIYTPGAVHATGGLVLSSDNQVLPVSVAGGNIVKVNGLQIVSGGPVLSYLSGTGIKVLQSNGTTYGSVNAGTLALGSTYAGVAAPTSGAIIEGNVGIGTTAPNEKLTVSGNISSSNVVYASGGNSNLWNSAYTSVNTISANGATTYTTVNTNSANWSSAYTTTNASSANWNSAYTTTNTNSANWSNAYTTTNANSANWNSTYTTVNANSANYILDGGNTKGANLLVGTNDGYALNLETAGTTKMSITSAGFVGIGVTAPSSILDINDSTGSQKSVVLSLRNGSFGWWAMTSSNSNTAGFLRFASNNSSLIPLTLNGDNGNVGIGATNPAARLDIADTTLAGSGSLAGSILNLAQTWNTTGAPTAIKLNVTNTGSGAASNLLDLQVDTSSKFKVGKGATGSANMSLGSSGGDCTFSTSGNLLTVGLGSHDVQLCGSLQVMRSNLQAATFFLGHNDTSTSLAPALLKDGNYILAQRNGINPQIFRVYNTYSSSTNFERAILGWDSNIFYIGTEKGSAGGAATPIQFYTNGIPRMVISSGGLVTVRDETGTQQRLINNFTCLNNSYGGSTTTATPWLLDAATNNILHNYSTRLTLSSSGSVAASGVYTQQIDWPLSELTDVNGMVYAEGIIIVRCYYLQNAASVRVRYWNNFSSIWTAWATAIDITNDVNWGVWRASVGGNYMTKLQVETTSPPGNSVNIQNIEYYPTRSNSGIRYPHMFAAQGASKLLIGGGKSTHAAIVGSGNTLKIRNGNDSADGSITAAAATFSTTLSVAGTSSLANLNVGGNILLGTGNMGAQGINLNSTDGRNTIGFGSPGSWFMGINAQSSNESLNITDANAGWPGTPRVTFLRGGNVGIGTITPNEKLTVAGNISSSNIVYALGGNSSLWNSAYTSVNTISANGATTYTTVNTNSANWSSVYTLTNSNSANWNSTYTTTNTNSANWSNAYTTVSTNSANYILDGGNTKGTNILVGTNDNFNLNLETAGTTRVTVTSAGSVGIGTTTPDSRLHINAPIGSKGQLQIQDTSAAGLPSSHLLSFYDNAGARQAYIYKEGASGKFGIFNDQSGSSIVTTLNNVLNVTGAGNVGIGTATPGGKLDVILSTSNTYTSESIKFGPSMTLAHYGSGYSGLWLGGTTSLNVPNANNYTLISDGTGTILNSPSGDVYVSVTNSPKLVVRGSGNVGIGSTLPTEKLTVVGNISSTNIIYASGGNSNLWNSAYTSVNTISANGATTFTTVNTNSSNWSNAYTTTNANSASWSNVYSTTNANSANWSSVYTTTNTNSANWSSVYSSYNAASATILKGTISSTGQGNITIPRVGGGNESVTISELGTSGNPTFNNLTVSGNLSVIGDFTYLNTGVSVTSALSVVNTGTGPALLVRQSGTTPIAHFIDADGTGDIVFANNGFVGIGTTSPTNLLHLNSVAGNGVAQLLVQNDTDTAVPIVQFLRRRASGAAVLSNDSLGRISALGSKSSTVNLGAGYIEFQANGSPAGFNNVLPSKINFVTFVNDAYATYTNSLVNGAFVAGGTTGQFIFNKNDNIGGDYAPDTGISRLSAGVIGIGNATAGTSGGTLIAGSIGIGTTNFTDAFLSAPGSLFANGNIKFGGTLRSSSSSLTFRPTYDNTALLFAASTHSLLMTSGGAGTPIIFGATDATDPLALYSGGGEKIRVTTAGNVGIGTTTPTSKLEIVDTTSAISLSGAALNIAHTWNAPGIDVTAIKLNVSSSASGASSKLIDLQIGGASYFNVDKNGATTMASAVFVNGGNSNLWNSNYTTTNTNSGRWSSVYTTVNTNSASYIVNGGNTLGGTITIGTNDANNFNLETNGTIRVSMSSTGQVGIGTTTPDADLVLYKNVIASPTTFKIRTATGTGSRLDFYRTDAYVATRFDVLSTNEFQFFNNNDVVTPKYIVNGTNGNFGIGTSSTVHKVTVGGSLSASGTLYGDCAVLGDATASVSLERDAANTLGIRTTTAAQTLNVYGTYTSGTNFERLTLAASALGGVIGHYAGGGGGVARDLLFQTSNATRMTIAAAGSVNVAGHFSAATKSFLIDHPTQEGKKLQYGVVESNQHSVLVRGKTSESIIELPEEWSGLVHEDSVTVQLTPIGSYQQLYVVSQDNQRVVVGGSTGKYNYTIYGERKDVDKLQTVV